jgi:hypothetical protein
VNENVSEVVSEEVTVLAVEVVVNVSVILVDDEVRVDEAVVDEVTVAVLVVVAAHEMPVDGTTAQRLSRSPPPTVLSLTLHNKMLVRPSCLKDRSCCAVP